MCVLTVVSNKKNMQRNSHSLTFKLTYANAGIYAKVNQLIPIMDYFIMTRVLVIELKLKIYLEEHVINADAYVSN